MNRDRQTRRRSVSLAAASLLLPLCLALPPRGAFAQNAVSKGTKAGFRMYYPNSNDWWLDPSKGSFDIRVNGQPAIMTLNALGDLGIGTTSPASAFSVGAGSPFQVSSSGNLAAISGVPYTWPASNASGVLTNTGAGTLSWAPASGGPWATTSAANIYNTNGGSVGIGTTNPTGGLLQVNASGNANGVWGIGGPSNGVGLIGTGGGALGDGVNAYGAPGGFDFWGGGNQSHFNGKVSIGGTANVAPVNTLDVSGSMAVGSYAFTAGPTNSLIVGGNVGIGTTNPSSTLDVEGNIANYAATISQNGGATSAYGGLLVNTNSTGVSSLMVNNSGSTLFVVKGNGSVGIGTTNPTMPLDVAGNFSSLQLRLERTGSALGGFNLGADSRGLRVDSDATPQLMEILQNGYVGIGTTNPSSTLDVEGSIANYVATISQNGGATSAYGGLLVNTNSTGVSSLMVNNSGSTLFVVKGNGSVGIGTTSPGSVIDIKQSVNGPTGGLRLSAASSANTWNIYHNGSSEDLGIARNNAASPFLSILAANGNVGIGTAAPKYGLDAGLGSTSWSVWNSWVAPAVGANILTGPAAQKINSRASVYAAVAARNPGTDFSVLMIPWDGSTTLENNCQTQINTGWHAQAVVKGNYFNQTFDNVDFTQYSSVITDQGTFDAYKSLGTQWWIGCSASFGPFAQSALTGSGAANYVAKFNASSNLVSSLVYDNGSAVGVGTTSPAGKLDVNGTIAVGGATVINASGQWVGPAPASASHGIQPFTTVGTCTNCFTVPAGVTTVYVTAAGGGGGGGLGAVNIGGGGGGGGAAALYYPVSVAPGAQITVIVGKGGTAASGSTASGGSGDQSCFSSTCFNGGSGGSAPSGTTTITGGAAGGSGGVNGGSGMAEYAYGYTGGTGGGTLIGAGGTTSCVGGPSCSGVSGGLFGGGGSGSSQGGTAGAGAQGAVFVFW